MATVDEIQAVLDPANTLQTCRIVKREVKIAAGETAADAAEHQFYVVGNVAPYAGKSRWVSTTQADSDATQGAAILAAMAA